MGRRSWAWLAVVVLGGLVLLGWIIRHWDVSASQGWVVMMLVLFGATRAVVEEFWPDKPRVDAKVSNDGWTCNRCRVTVSTDGIAAATDGYAAHWRTHHGPTP